MILDFNILDWRYDDFCDWFLLSIANLYECKIILVIFNHTILYFFLCIHSIPASSCNKSSQMYRSDEALFWESRKDNQLKAYQWCLELELPDRPQELLLQKKVLGEEIVELVLGFQVITLATQAITEKLLLGKSLVTFAIGNGIRYRTGSPEMVKSNVTFAYDACIFVTDRVADVELSRQNPKCRCLNFLGVSVSCI